MSSPIPIIFFILCNSAAQAQFTDSTTHLFRFSAAGNLNRSNNTAAYLLNNDARFSIQNKRTTLNTMAAWLYGEQGSTLTNNDFISTTDFNLYIDSSNLYYWALANYTTSFSLKISNQLQGGLGVGYNVVNKDNAWLNISEGIIYESSNLTTGNPELDRYQTFRNSLRLAYKFTIQKAVTFSGSNFVQHALGDASDNIIRTNNSLSVKLNTWMSIGTTITYNRFRRTGTENLLFAYGLMAEKYF